MNQCEATMQLVRSTGKALLERLSCVELNIKRKDNSHKNLVTDFDVWAQNELKQGLAKIEPAAGFFAEEQVNTEANGLTRFVDPIDGTTNFIASQHNYAICVALYDGAQPIFGIVYDVAGDICYHATLGEGAYKNGVLLKKREEVLLENAVVDASLTTINALSRRAGTSVHRVSCLVRGHRALGCASLAMCHIAEGTLDAYASCHLFPWDYAAAGVIVKECGGIYTSLYDEPLMTTKSATFLCSGDSHLHNQLAAYLRGDTEIEECLS